MGRMSKLPPHMVIPLSIAAICGKAEVASLLLTKGAAVDALDKHNWTPLIKAAGGGHVAAAIVLLAAGAGATLRNVDDMSALDTAAKGGHVDVLRAFIEHGVDVNAADGSGLTATNTAAACGRAAVIDVLADADANINQETSTGDTPLHVAAFMTRPAAVTARLKHGARVSKKAVTGETPLHGAACRAGRAEAAEVVDLLLRHGADEEAIANNGKTPADFVGIGVDEHDDVDEELERVRKLLAKAPADRAWHRWGFLVLCCAHYPSGRVQLQLGYGSSHAHDTMIAKRTRSRAEPSRAEAEWAGVASMLMGAGADPISLMGDGADLIFEAIVGYL